MSIIEASAIERKIAERIDENVSSNLAISRETGGLAFTNATEAINFSKMMAVSQIGVRKHLRGNVGACLAITVQAIEWGMSPFAVANKSYLVNDQIAYESQLVQAVILRRAPIKGRFKFGYTGEGDKRRCKVTATLADGDIVEYESPEIGKIPVKNSPLWKNDPDQQLSYYSGRALCRRHFPDVLLGIYDVDEMPETTRDPERARNVTPARLTTQQRLDALAGETIDAETGEITNTNPAASTAPLPGVADQAAGSEQGSVTGPAYDDPAADTHSGEVAPPKEAAGAEGGLPPAADAPAELLDKARAKAILATCATGQSLSR